jgi:ribosomal protein S18 acetylase RimI-like enzyme
MNKRPEVAIVQLDRANTGLLTHIAPEVFDHAIHPEYLAAFVSDPRHLMFLAIEQELVVGMISGVEYFHPDKPSQMWINEVGVAATHRRRGLGGRLLVALVDAARRRGCAYAWLGTEQSNVVAQACFRSVPGGKTAQPFLLYEWDLEEK